MSTLLLWLAVIVGGVAIGRLFTRLQATQKDLDNAWREIERLVEPPAVVEPQPPAPDVEVEERPLEPVELPAIEEPPPLSVDRGTPSPAPPGEEIPAPEPSAGPPQEQSISIDWERWVGIRGAAVLGGAVLALAMILFLKYSIEHGLIPPIVRVALGFLAGGGSIVGSEVMRRRRYGVTADAVAGAGVVMLYAAVWAAQVLYGLIPSVLAWVLMVLVTLVCGLLSWRRESLVIAVLGLTGGFLTPLLLTSGRFNPISLFSYVLLLDVGLLWLASRRRWPILTALSLGGTFLFQTGWVFLQMPPARFALTLGILGLFALLFAFAGRRTKSREDAAPAHFDRLARAAGVLLPFLFALHFAGRADLGRHLAPLAALLTLLSLAAVWIGRTRGVAWLPLAAAAADVGVIALWVARTRLTTALAWELAAVGTVLALAFHWPLELNHRRTRSGDGWRAAALVVGGLAVLVVFGRLVASQGVFWPWLTGWLLLTAFWLRQAAIVPQPRLRLAAAAVPAVAFTAFLAGHGGDATMPSVALYLGLMVLIAAAFQLLGLSGPAPSRLAPQRLDAEAPDAAAALAALGTAAGMLLMADYPGFGAGYFFVTTIALGLLAVFAATRLGSGEVYLAAAAVMVIAQTAWAFGARRLDGSETAAVVVLAGSATSVLIVTFWPFLAGGKLPGSRLTLYTAALAGPVWFPVLRRAYERLFGDTLIAILPIALGVVALAAALRGRRFWAPADAAHKRSLAWFLAVALGFVSLAIPLQLDKEWVTLGWALQGLAVMALWKRLDHPGLRYLGLGLFAAVTLRLVANPALLGYYQRSGSPVFNWLMYTYLVPAAALLWSARIQEPLEVDRRSPWEKEMFSGRHPLGAAACGIAVILVVFVWINLTIVDAFSRGPELSLSLERLPARDLTLSLAWTVFAVVLLAIGMARRSVALRWISLAFLILAMGKVFLYDLGELRDLYRVASLVGLAISLLLVSLAYQRFVFAENREGLAEEE